MRSAITSSTKNALVSTIVFRNGPVFRADAAGSTASAVAVVDGRVVADMAVELVKGELLALHLGRRKDAGTLRPDQVGPGKLNDVREALDICRPARTILGANGISLEFPVIGHMNNLEAVLTYEGTVEMHTLVLGQTLTGIPAYR